MVRYPRDGQPATGVVQDGRVHALPNATPALEQVRPVHGAGPDLPESLLAPVRPGTVFGMAHNTGAADRELPPGAFLKAAASVIGPEEPISAPCGIGRVDAEDELAAVIGAPLWNVRQHEVARYLLGYTVALDVTARDAQQTDPLWTETKSRRGFTPLGPWIEADLDPSDARIVLSHNGSAVASGSTAGLARTVFESVAYLSTLVDLRPRDVVLTGASDTFAPVREGDVVTAEIAGIGELRCPVVGVACE